MAPRFPRVRLAVFRGADLLALEQRFEEWHDAVTADRSVIARIQQVSPVSYDAGGATIAVVYELVPLSRVPV